MLTVTKLEQQKKNPRRINVYLNGEFAFGISRTIAPWLEEGKEVSKQYINDLQNQDKIESGYQRALNYLSYRNRSEKEIRLNLQKHEISTEHIDLVLDKLRQNSLINDHQFAQEWVDNRSRFKPRGKRALSSELFQKGIEQSVIEDVLKDLDEKALAQKLAQNKLSRLRDLDQSAFQKKMYGYLSRRGFSYGICKDIISTLVEELELQS
jgi:regulatory protein